MTAACSCEEAVITAREQDGAGHGNFAYILASEGQHWWAISEASASHLIPSSRAH